MPVVGEISKVALLANNSGDSEVELMSNVVLFCEELIFWYVELRGPDDDLGFPGGDACANIVALRLAHCCAIFLFV